MKLKELLQELNKKLVIGVITIARPIIDLVIHRVTIGVLALILGFVFGARMHEVGFLEGFFGKSIKGATVFLSGPCKVNGIPRVPALAEDEVKITGEGNGQITGVIRKTREVVICDVADIAVDKLPLLANLKKSPVEIPELEAMKIETKEPEYKKLIQRTLVMSGSCVSISGKELPPFTDEKVDVTNVEQSKDNPNGFIISGIKKSDKISISCPNTAVKYEFFVEKDAMPEVIPVVEKPKSYIGETILVTSTCFPDPRLPKHKQDKKVAFYPLVNSPVQITEESLDSSGKIKKLAGAALHFGSMIVCDGNKFPLTYKEFDSESMKLAPINPTKSGVESDETSGINLKSSEGIEADAGKPASASNELNSFIKGVNEKNLEVQVNN